MKDNPLNSEQYKEAVDKRLSALSEANSILEKLLNDLEALPSVIDEEIDLMSEDQILLALEDVEAWEKQLSQRIDEKLNPPKTSNGE